MGNKKRNQRQSISAEPQQSKASASTAGTEQPMESVKTEENGGFSAASIFVPMSTVMMILIVIVLQPDHANEMLNIVLEFWNIDKWNFIGFIIAFIFFISIANYLITKLWRDRVAYLAEQRKITSILEVEKKALEIFFIASNGQRWKDKTRWCSKIDPVRSWKGVSCDKSGRVTKLILPRNNLSGLQRRTYTAILSTWCVSFISYVT